MAKVNKINHIGIAVADIDESLKFWRDIMGIELSHVEDAVAAKSRVAFLPVGESDLELVAPLSDDAPVAKYLAEKGSGIHHICIEVDDVAGTLADLKAKGVRLIDEEPKEMPGRKMAFIHPKSTGGVLLELYEITK